MIGRAIIASNEIKLYFLQTDIFNVFPDFFNDSLCTII